jgi:hypothetical protein
MCFGYDGQQSLLWRSPFFAAVGVFCALCAILVGAATHLVLTLAARR